MIVTLLTIPINRLLQKTTTVPFVESTFSLALVSAATFQLMRLSLLSFFLKVDEILSRFYLYGNLLASLLHQQSHTEQPLNGVVMPSYRPAKQSAQASPVAL